MSQVDRLNSIYTKIAPSFVSTAGAHSTSVATWGTYSIVILCFLSSLHGRRDCSNPCDGSKGARWPSRAAMTLFEPDPGREVGGTPF